MKDKMKKAKDIDTGNNEIDKYFEMDIEQSFNSYIPKNSNIFSNLEDSFNEENSLKNQNNNKKLNDYGNNKMNINKNKNKKEIISNFSNFFNFDANEYANPFIKKTLKNNIEGNLSEYSAYPNSFNDINSNNIHNKINNLDNSTQPLNTTNYDKKDSIKNKFNLDLNNLTNNNINLNNAINNFIFPNYFNESNMNNAINNNFKNNNNSNEEIIIDKLSLSSSSEDIQIVSGEDFRKHFQEDRFGPQMKIKIIDQENQLNKPFSQYNGYINSQINKNQSYNKCFENFFMNEKKEKKNMKNRKISEKNQKINLLNSSKSDKEKEIMNKRRKFYPLSKDQYKEDKVLNKLYIYRLEKQILTDIYDEYEKKEYFDQTYYHIDKIKYLINQKGVEEAIKYLESIQPANLRNRIIMESTFFFKEIIRKEIEFADNNDGKLILFKQPDFLFKQNLKYHNPFSGKDNKNNNKSRRNNIKINEEINTHIDNIKSKEMNNNNIKKKLYIYNSPQRNTKCK